MLFPWLSFLKLLSGASFTVLFLWLLLKDQKLAQVFQIISEINLWTFFISMLLIVLSQFIRIVRWWRMLDSLNCRISLIACVGPYLMSTAVNNLVPLRAGDVYRIFGFRKRLGIPSSQILCTLISERLLDVIVLCSFFLVGLYGLTEASWKKNIVLYEVIICLFILLCLWAVMKASWVKAILSKMVLWKSFFLRVLTFDSTQMDQKENDNIVAETSSDEYARSFVPSGSKSWQRRILQLLHALDILRSFPVSIQLLGLTILSWSFSAAVYTIIAFALAPDVDMKGAWLALSSANFGVFLPGGPASLGNFDYFAAVGLIAYGVSKTVATSFALIMHAVLWGPTTIMGAFCFVWQHFTKVKI